MNNIIAKFIRAKRIDSFRKLHFLLFLQQHPDMEGTSQEFSERLYLGDTLLVEEIASDLQKAGLLVSTELGWKLAEEPDIKNCLHSLARTFENPLARQELLEQMRHNVPFS